MVVVKASNVERVKKMLLRDELRLPGGAMEMLRSELIGTIEGYFDIDEKSVAFSVVVTENVGYVFSLQGVAKSVKKVKTIE